MLGVPNAANAACEWYFNWYCPGCAKIGARTTGTNGGFADRQSCEAARASMQGTMDSRGGGVRTVACQSTGACDMPRVPPTTRPGGGPAQDDAGSAPPAVDGPDHEAERREREVAQRREQQAERERQARIERESQERVRRDREEALNQMKGAVPARAAGLKGGGADPGLKGLPAVRQAESPSDKFTVWHQLNCVAETLDEALAWVDKAEPREDLAHGLAEKLKSALSWNESRSLCQASRSPPARHGDATLSGAPLLKFHDKVVRAGVRDAETLKRVSRELATSKASMSPGLEPKAVKAALRHLPASSQMLDRVRSKLGPLSAQEQERMEEEVLFADLEVPAARPSPGVWTRLVVALHRYLSEAQLRERATMAPAGLERHRNELIPGQVVSRPASDLWEPLRAKRAAALEAAQLRYYERLNSEIARLKASRPTEGNETPGAFIERVERELKDDYVAAMRSATSEMKQAIAALQTKGILVPGEDVRAKMALNPTVRAAVLEEQAKVVAKERAAFEAARQRAIEKLETRQEERRERDVELGTLAQRITDEVLAELDREWQEFFREFINRNRSAKLAQKIEKSEFEKSRAAAALKTHRALIAQALADPTQADVVAAKIK